MCRAYSGLANPDKKHTGEAAVPRTGPAATIIGRPPTAPKTNSFTFPVMTACEDVTNDGSLPNAARNRAGTCAQAGATVRLSRYESQLTAVDPFTGDVKRA